MARVKGKKVLKRYARAKSVFGVKSSSHPEYVKVECSASSGVRGRYVTSTNRAVKAHFNPDSSF